MMQGRHAAALVLLSDPVLYHITALCPQLLQSSAGAAMNPALSGRWVVPGSLDPAIANSLQ